MSRSTCEIESSVDEFFEMPKGTYAHSNMRNKMTKKHEKRKNNGSCKKCRE